MYRIDNNLILRNLLIGLGLLLLSLVAVHPFLNEALPLTDDGVIHLYRSIVLDHSLRHDGTFYPRYASALAYGYGAPLFNYFPPTTYYPTVALHALGLSWVAAWKATVIFYVWIAAVGAFLLGRIWLDDRAGWLTAAAYVYAPYALFDTVTRGTSSEYAAMAFLPLVLWALTRLARSGKRRDFALATGFYALFIILHNIITLYGTLLLIVYCLLLVWQSDQRWRTLTQLALSGVLALLLTAFFWWPALAETQFVKIDGVTQTLDFIDVTNSLRPLSVVFALPQTADPSQLGRAVPASFAWPTLPLAFVALWLTRRERNLRGLSWLLFAVIAVVTFSQLEISAAIWRVIPLLGYSQFATRALSIGSLALALLAGIGGGLLLRRMRPVWALSTFAVLLSVMILYALPWLYRPAVTVAAETVADAQRYERQTGQIALSSFGEYLPIWNTINPDRDALFTQFEAGNRTPSRLQLTDTVTVETADWRGTSADLNLVVDSAQTLVFDWLYVPGWRATINGSSTDVFPVGDAGLVGMDVPVGEHQITIRLALTDTQRNASLLGALALLMMGGVLLVGWRWWIPTAEREQSISENGRWLLTAGAIGLVLFVVKIGVIDTTNNPFRTLRFPELATGNAQIAAEAVFSAGIRLLDYDVENVVQSGSTARIRLFWALSGESLESDFSSRVILTESNGLIVASASRFYPGGVATSNWLPGAYVEDVIVLEIPQTIAPADYTLAVGLFDAKTGAPVDVLDAAGNPSGVVRSVSALTVLPPDSPATVSQDVIFSDSGVELLAIDGLPETAQVGDEMIVRWLWRKVSDTDRMPERAQLVWVDNTGEEFGGAWVPLVTDYPLAQWAVGDVWRGVQRVYVPPPVVAGEATMHLRLRFGDSMTALSPALVPMQVTVPERVYELPDGMVQADDRWQGGITLAGYNFSETGVVSLYWQTDIPPQTSYRLFVQAFDRGGNLLALTDGIPADWTRPTTGWIPGEIVTTQHDFGAALSDAETLLIGWYDPLTDARVRLDAGNEDALRLPLP